MGLSLVSPWALVGLLALPLIWWLQKRLRRPPDVELPSLMFLLDEEDARSLPRGRLVDAELLLALAAAALLALAAAGPVLERSAPQAVVRVAVSGGSPAARRGYRDDVEATLAALRAAVDDETVVEVVRVPSPGGGDLPVPRPAPEDLIASALAGEASRRYVLSDAAPPSDLAGVTWLALGRGEAENTGIVAASVAAGADGPALFVTLSHDGARPVAGRLHVAGIAPERGIDVRVEAGGFASVSLPLGRGARAPLRVALQAADGTPWSDALAADDVLVLTHGALRVAIDPALPAALVARIHAGLTAALGEGGFVVADAAVLGFGPPRPEGTGPPMYVAFTTVAQDAPTETAPDGPLRVRADPLVRDLAAAGGRWVYAAGAAAAAAGEDVLLGVADGARTWPVVTRKGHHIRLVPDPLRGVPRVVDTPFWPLFLQNVVQAAGHASVGEGWHAAGLLDPASSRAARTRDTLDASGLASLPAARPGVSRSLRPLLIACALLCLALLWAAPRIRRQFARRARALRAKPLLNT